MFLGEVSVGCVSMLNYWATM